MLLKEVKEELKITWDDEDSSLQRMLVRAKGDLDALIGVKLDLEENTRANTLFLNYCRYDYNNSLEYFRNNFQDEIIELQLSEGVKSDAIKEK